MNTKYLIVLAALALAGCSTVPSHVEICGLQCSVEASNRNTGKAPDPYAHLTPSQQAAMRVAAAYNAGQAVNGTSAGVSAHPAPVSSYGALGASGILELSRCKIDRAGNPDQVAECYALLPKKLQADMLAVDRSTFVHNHSVTVILVRERSPAHQ